MIIGKEGWGAWRAEKHPLQNFTMRKKMLYRTTDAMKRYTEKAVRGQNSLTFAHK